MSYNSTSSDTDEPLDPQDDVMGSRAASQQLVPGRIVLLVDNAVIQPRPAVVLGAVPSADLSASSVGNFPTSIQQYPVQQAMHILNGIP